MVHSSSGELGLTLYQGVIGEEELQAHVRVVPATVDKAPARRSFQSYFFITLKLSVFFTTASCHRRNF